MNESTLLAIDDDPDFLDVLEVLVEIHGHRLLRARDLNEANSARGQRPKVVLLDWQLDEQDGLELIPRLKTLFPRTPIVLTTAYSSTAVAVEAMQAGAFDFLPKPLDEARLVTTLTRGIAQFDLLQRVEGIDGARPEVEFEGLVGGSPQMRTVFETISNVASTDVSVLITGESGTGKELVAQAIHQRSARRRGPFVALNMAAIPKDLVESTLFGHEKGSFSGADKRKIGACEEANGGTLFLDEIGEMPLELQSKLLRFLQEQTLRRVGGTADVRVDVRVVSATNRPPLETVRGGGLRADLYYRLNVVPIELPPLRERPGDVALIATRRLTEDAKRYGKGFTSFSPEALAILEAHPWPGNVRELLHAIERIVITQDGSEVSAGMIPPQLLGARRAKTPTGPALAGPAPSEASLEAAPSRPTIARAPADPLAAPPPAPSTPAVFGAEVIPLAELERMAIEHALERHEGSRELAAKALGISQATIYRKLKAYGLTTRKLASNSSG